MILSNAVFLFSIGTNDYISPFVLKNSSMLPSHQEYIAMVIGNLTQVVKVSRFLCIFSKISNLSMFEFEFMRSCMQAVYKRGGRKFGFLNLGDLGCLPGLRISKPQNGSGCLEEASTLAKLHNEALQNVLNKMKNHLKGFKYSLYDFNTFLRQILNHPSRYGIT